MLRHLTLDVEGDIFESPRKVITTLPDTIERIDIRLAVPHLAAELDDMLAQCSEAVVALSSAMIAMPPARLPRFKSALLTVATVVQAEVYDEAHAAMARITRSWRHAFSERDGVRCEAAIELNAVV